MIYSMCHDSVRGRLSAEVDYQSIISQRRYNSMMLYRFIQRICNGSTSVIGEDVIGNMMESLYNFLMVRGEDYESVPKYFEVVNHRYTILKESGFDLATDSLRDTLIVELSNRGQSESHFYKRLTAWRNASRDKLDDTDIAVDKEALMQAFRSRVCVKRAGRRFDEFRIDAYNGYFVGSREYPFDMVETYRQMVHYRPVIINEAKR